MKKLLSIILALAMLLSTTVISTLMIAEAASAGSLLAFSEDGDESENPGSEATEPTDPEESEEPGGETTEAPTEPTEDPGDDEDEPTNTPEPTKDPGDDENEPTNTPEPTKEPEPSASPSEVPSASSSAAPTDPPKTTDKKKENSKNTYVHLYPGLFNASSAKKNNAKNAAYISGYNDGTFKPDEKVTRAETMAMLARLSEDFDENKTYTSKFPDVVPGSWSYNYIGFAESKNFASGYEDGYFLPYRTISRAEFAVIITNFAGLNTVNGTGTAMPFNDVTGHWAYGRIQLCYKNGYINGYDDGTFRPNEPISRVEAVSIINKVIGRSASTEKTDKNKFIDIPPSYWGYGNIMSAANGVQ